MEKEELTCSGQRVTYLLEEMLLGAPSTMEKVQRLTLMLTTQLLEELLEVQNVFGQNVENVKNVGKNVCQILGQDVSQNVGEIVRQDV